MMTPQTPGLDPWIIQPVERQCYQEQFLSLNPTNGIITGEQAKGFFLRSQLPPVILGRIWALSDTDTDGKMDINEFSIACKLINLKLRGYELPESLPLSMVQSVKSFSPDSMGSLTNGAMAASAKSNIVPLMNLSNAGQITQPSIVPPVVSPPLIGPPPSSGTLQGHLMTSTMTLPGANFTTTIGPPPKPAPPSFPNSPAGAGISQIKPPNVTATAIVPPLPPVQSMVAPVVGPVPPIAPIVPLNTNPTPIAAFDLGQTMSIQSGGNGIVAAPIPGVISSGAPLTTGLPLTSAASSTPISVGATMNGVVVHTPVSTNTPLSTTARPPSMDRVGSIDSQHSTHSIGSPQIAEWAVPHQTKLKYTQLFNTWDKTRSGFLSGPQARNIMVQSQLPQQILARIWSLADMDLDGRLSCDEFVLAMHLTDIAKAGEQIPTALPIELIPPTFRRQRQSSLTPSQCSIENVDPSAGMPQTSFEDKRKENFEKGQAELDRRRKAFLEVQRKEQEERERKEREEAEKQEKMRLEQERRRQAELEQQMLRQKEIEQEKEEQRKRAQEQREAARKEMERQRQLEWEKQKSQELQAQRQKEQDILLKLKAKNQTLTIELGTLNDKVKELSQKICDTRVGVSGVKTTIDGMRSTRDAQLQEMAALKSKLREQNQRLLSLSQEKARIEAKNKLNAAQDVAGQEAIKMAFDNKQITLKQMKDKIADLQQQIDAKMADIENNNGQLKDIKTQIRNLIADCKKLHSTFQEKKNKVLELRKVSGTGIGDYAAWGESAWHESTSGDDSAWPIDNSESIKTVEETSGIKRYRALYEFVARNQDEISFQPGDIILVPPVQNAEPGWMAGEIRGHTGWFPESYVEPIDSWISNGNTFIQQDSMEKRTLEGIAEVPENVSDAGSLGGEQPITDLTVPTLGLGTTCNVQVTALSQYRPSSDQHLSFDKGDIINVSEQQGDWWYGESNNGIKGWFPKSYVKEMNAQGNEVEGLNEYYVALYQYSSGESGDLSFGQGEIILVIKKEGDWWTGCIGDRTGIFPSNYVEKYDVPDQQSAAVAKDMEFKSAITELTTGSQRESIHDVSSEPLQIEKTAEQLEDERQAAEDRAELPDFAAMSAQQRGRKPEIVQVIAPYQATSAEQLDLQRGQLIMIRKKTDSGWWEGELQARGKKRQIGWFPASYVKPLTSSSNRSTPVSHRYQDSPTDPNVERVMALYPYQAQNEDELSFEKGDVITVLAKEEEAWWRGELNGVSGVFPSNYVSSMCK